MTAEPVPDVDVYVRVGRAERLYAAYGKSAHAHTTKHVAEHASEKTVLVFLTSLPAFETESVVVRSTTDFESVKTQ